MIQQIGNSHFNLATFAYIYEGDDGKTTNVEFRDGHSVVVSACVDAVAALDSKFRLLPPGWETRPSRHYVHRDAVTEVRPFDGPADGCAVFYLGYDREYGDGVFCNASTDSILELLS